MTVKNINTSISLNVTFNVKNINSSWTSVADKNVIIAKSTEKDFTVTFTVPSGAEVKDYGGQFEASSTQQNKTADFTLRVLPAAARQVEIKSQFDDLRKNFTALWTRVNETRAAGFNMTDVDAKFNETSKKIDEAQALINQNTPESIFAALQLFGPINNLIKDTDAAIQSAKQRGSPWPDWLIYVGAGGAVAVVAFVVYLFLPTKVALPRPGILPGPKPGQAGEKKNLLERLFRKKDKLSKYQYRSPDE